MLTDMKARTAKPRPKPYKLADGNSLSLLISPSGSKLWRWNYTYDGKHKTLALGAYPLVSLADARGKRDEAYTFLSEGRDPAVVKKLKIEANLEASRQTFEKIACQWYENAKAQWAKIHASDVIRSLERDAFPTIGSLPIGAAADTDGDDAAGGLEQARHPAHEPDRPLSPDPITADPLGLGEDDGDLSADQRTMDQARALSTARSVYALDAGADGSDGHRPGDIQLDL